MTKKSNYDHLLSALSLGGKNSVTLEMRKTRIGASLVAMNVMGVGELSDTEIVLLSHSGRLTVTGEGLILSVFEDKSIEIFGRINGVSLDYAKNR